MHKRECFDLFEQGKTDRAVSPLPHGQFKLREIRYQLASNLNDVINIENFLRRRATLAKLKHCTSEDKHLWLKRLPGWIAYQLGYKILAGLDALEGDQVSAPLKAKLVSRLEALTPDLLCRLENVRCSLVKNINSEYARMRNGEGELRPVVTEVVSLLGEFIDQAFPAHLQEVSEK